jgi:hypothetical protein
MAERSNLKRKNALKHGAYSTIGLLPGESPAEFKKHLKVVVDELRPNGPVELDIVLTIARLLWRKRNLASLETAKLVNFRFRQILEEEKKSRGYPHYRMFVKGENHAALEEALRAAQTQACSELGDWDWDEFRDHDFGTIERLVKDVELVERLDGIIDKCLRRLLMVRGVKSVALAPPSEPPQIHKPRDVNRPAKDQVQGQAPPEAAATVEGQGLREAAHCTENREVRDQARPAPPAGVPETWAICDVAAAPHGAGAHVPQADHAGAPSLVGPRGTRDLGTPPSGGGRHEAKKEDPGAGPTARGVSAEIPNGGGAEDRLNPGQGTAEPTLVPPPHDSD